MTKRIKFFQIDSFTSKAFAGNPAGVVMDDDLSDSEMFLITKEMNLPEIAFISSSKTCDYKLRWITPTTEVDLCGHATIAVLHYLKENNLLKSNQEIKFETRSGILRCGFSKDLYYMEIPVLEIELFSHNKENIFSALRIKKSITNTKIPLLLYNKILYININFLIDLNNVSPDFNELKKICTNSPFNSLMLFTLQTNEEKNHAYSRFFAPAEGIDEDIVTGSANGPLLLILKELNMIDTKSEEIFCTFEQGDALGRSGRVNVKYHQKKSELFIMGEAVTILRGELLI